MNLLERPISELLQEAPSRARIFERFKFDYGCGNQQTLAEACRDLQIDPQTVLDSLSAETSPSQDGFVPIRLGPLADEIVSRHHHYVHLQGPRVQELLDKVSRVHGGKEPRLLTLWSLFQQLHADLLRHMLKEEAVLFPYCKQLEHAEELLGMHCGSVAMPIRVMESEHRQAQEQADQIRQLTDNFSPPAWACNSMRVLYHELASYLADLEVHMHLENDLLFPAALRREEELQARPAAP